MRTRFAMGALLVLSVLSSCAEPDRRARAAAEREPESAGSFSENQEALLDFAMATITKLPTGSNVHMKDRSRVQQEVIEACLELEQPDLAASYLAEVKNWRKGLSAAKIAYYRVKRDASADVEKLLKLSEAYLKLADQEWRGREIEKYRALVELERGRTAAADRFQSGEMSDRNLGKMAIAKAKAAGEMTLSGMSDELDEIIAKDRYEGILNAGDGYVELYAKHYGDEATREEIETKVRRAYRNMGGPEKLRLFIGLGSAAVDNGDVEQATAFIGEAWELHAKVDWRRMMVDKYEIGAALAKLMARAGGEAEAVAKLDALREDLSGRLERIYNIWRAESFTPLASAYHVLGREEMAAAVYGEALKHSRLNPNSRPRAIDLAQICVSMAKVDFAPGEQLWHNLRAAQSGLGNPW